MLLGWGLGKLLTVTEGTSFLITAGTAICGGSAIAAIAPITDASEEEIGSFSRDSISAELGRVADVSRDRNGVALDSDPVWSLVGARDS